MCYLTDQIAAIDAMKKRRRRAIVAVLLVIAVALALCGSGVVFATATPDERAEAIINMGGYGHGYLFGR